MEQQLYDLLPDTLPNEQISAEKWYDNEFTQGNHKSIEKNVHIFGNSTPTHTATPTPDTEPEIPPEVVTGISNNAVKPSNKPKTEKDKKPTKGASISFVDMLAARIDDMFHIYSYETKRDIREHLKIKLIDWASINARSFFGPSASRSISVCLRGVDVAVDDTERFAQMVSFFLNAPVKAGNKVVVWHGYDNSVDTSGTGREPVCSLVIKKQGVFVENMKI